MSFGELPSKRLEVRGEWPSGRLLVFVLAGGGAAKLCEFEYVGGRLASACLPAIEE